MTRRRRDVPCEGEGHVDAVESHPVDFFLPSAPVPEGGGVADGTDIHVVTVFDGELGMEEGRSQYSVSPGLLDGRKNIGKVKVAASAELAPGNGSFAVVLQVVVEAYSHGDRTCTLDDNGGSILTGLCELEDVEFAFVGDLLKVELADVLLGRGIGGGV